MRGHTSPKGRGRDGGSRPGEGLGYPVRALPSAARACGRGGPPYDPALTLSRILPSISSRPAGTAGYHLMLSIAACGKLSAYCSLSLPCVSLSAPFEAVKLPAEAATLAAISGRMLKLIHL